MRHSQKVLLSCVRVVRTSSSSFSKALKRVNVPILAYWPSGSFHVNAWSSGRSTTPLSSRVTRTSFRGTAPRGVPALGDDIWLWIKLKEVTWSECKHKCVRRSHVLDCSPARRRVECIQSEFRNCLFMGTLEMNCIQRPRTISPLYNTRHQSLWRSRSYRALWCEGRLSVGSTQ